MTLLAPWALWFLAAAGAVVALYLLKIKRRHATVPALDFWLALAGRTKVHSLFERLKRLLSMLLWLAIAVGLAIALGNPIVSLGRVKPRAIAIIVDDSASMQTAEAAPGDTPAAHAAASRFALAKKAVDDLTRHRPVTDQWLLIEAVREPRVLVPWTYDARSIRAGAASVPPFSGSADLRPAVELAKQLLAGKPDPCIVVISDGAAGTLQSLASGDPAIVPWPVGAATDNLGIARLAVRTDRQHGNYQALVSIINASDQRIDSQMTFQINGSADSVELLAIEPRSTWEKTVTIDPPGDTASTGGVLRALIDRPDALGLDNEAFAILQPIRPAIVWLVSSPETAFFFEQALGAMDPLVSTDESLTMSIEQYESVAAAAGTPVNSRLPPPDLVIFNNCSPRTLPAARHAIFMNGWPEQLHATVAGSLEAPQLFLAPRPHALTDHVTLQGARLAKARKMSLAEPARVIAQTAAGDPLIVLFEQPDRQTLCFAFDILDSDLPFRNAFPLMLRNAVAFMHEDAPSYLRPEVRMGETIRPTRPLPAGAGTAQLAVLRDGVTREIPTPVRDGLFTFTDTQEAGAIRLTVGNETAFAGVSLADGAESRIAPFVLPPEEDPAVRLSLTRGLLAFGGVPWVTLVLLATALVALEWLTFHFRWTESLPRMRFDAALFWIVFPALLLWVVWLARRSYAQLGPRARWGSAALRLVIIAALLGALSRPVWLRSSHAQHVLFLLDASRSVTRDNLEAALTDVGRLASEATAQGHRVSVIAFGRRPRLLIDSITSWPDWAPDQRDLILHDSALPALRSRLAQMITQASGDSGERDRAELQKHIEDIEEFRSSTIGEATDARAGLRLALNAGAGARGETRTIYLFTDANFNAAQSPESGWREALADASAAGHTVHTIALNKPIGPEVAAGSLSTPSSVRVNQGFAADLHIASTVQTPPDKPAKIAVYRDGFAMAELTQDLHPGENTVHIPGLSFRDKGFHTIDAAVRIDPSLDSRPENNRVRALITVPGELRVLYVDSDEAHQSFLTSALALEGVKVEARPASGVPQSLDDLLGFDCFILANIPADQVGGRQMQMIRSYVQDFGGGFIMIGGDQAFGLGGYYGTPIEEILPVRMPIQKDLNRPSIAIEIIIDKSGSMEGPKMQLAKRAALATSEAINPRDQIGVVAFDSEAREILPLTSAGDRATISAGISSLDAGGGTFLYPAMEIAHSTLQQSPARRKHCIIVSDGMTQGFGYADMAALMAADGITISTVGIGGDADVKTMQEIASSGAGRSYFTNDFNSIPQIFTREALRASNSMLVERLVLPTSAAEDESLSEVDSGQLPPLAGYVATTAKETAKVVLISDSGDPILARWRSGLGRTAAFTSDTKPHWAEDWIRWPDFAKFWAQLVRSCAGHEVANELSIESARHAEDGADTNRLTLELRDASGGFVSDRTLELTAFDPQSGPQSIPVEREAPGLYAARAPQGEYGRTQQFAWKIMAAARPGDKSGSAIAAAPEPVTIPFGFVDSFSPEFRTLGPNAEILDQIRALHAGDIADVGRAALHLSERASFCEIELWPWLVALAIMLVPVDILIRRLS